MQPPSQNVLAPIPVKQSRFSGTLPALKHPNFKLWFFGQMFSLVGTWMQSTAQGYLIYELTGSTAFLGYIGFAAGVPAVLLTLYGGLIADRFPRQKLLIITQVMMMTLAIILAALTFTGLVQPWHILVMAFFLGIANAFDAPARQSFVYELVEEKADLTNAIALHATMFNAAMVVGPSVGGIIYALVGPAWCFTFNAFSFIFVLTALFLMKLKPFVPPPKKRSALLEIKEGLQYVAHHPTIRVLIAGIGVSSLLAFAYVTLFPAWAKDVLNGNEATNGYLQSARGVGALIGALLIAFMGRRSKRGVWLTIGTFTFSTIMFIYAQSRWLPASLVLLAGIGFGYIIFANLTNSLVQTQVTDELRGRVMGIYVFTFFGLHPIGSLIAGLLAARVGAPTTLMINSVVLLLFASIAFIKFPQIRRLE